MYNKRKEYIEQLENEYEGHLISYVTSDRVGFETQIASDAIDLFISHLDRIGAVNRIILYLYTRGGDISAAWNIVNLLRIFCEELCVIVPHKAHSAGTIISLGADRIIMTKQATLSPIDPSVTTPLNPVVNSNLLPVSVEAINGYIELAKEEFSLKSPENLQSALIKLSEDIHPLVLGQAYRTRAQIKMLADRLLDHQIKDKGVKEKIIDFLCSESGSHDYTINRREAKDILNLKVEAPSIELYQVIKDIYDDYSAEMGFGQIFDPRYLDGAFTIRRAFIESNRGGSDYFVTEARALPAVAQNGHNTVVLEKDYEGWRHEQDKAEIPQQITEQEGVLRYEAADEYGL